jgi:hypothetical protein
MSLAAIIFVSLLTTAVGPQSSASAQPTPPQNPDALPVSLAHIRKGLDESKTQTPAAGAPKLRVDSANLPVFRTRTTSTGVPLSSVLDDGTNVGVYVRPANGVYDYEFKQMFTPDAVKGCGRLTSSECFQSYSSQFLSSLLWQRATQRKKTAEAQQ